MQCAGTTKTNKRCRNKACVGSTMCRLHTAQAAPAPQAHRCTARTQNGNRCSRNQVEHGMCRTHVNMFYDANYIEVVGRIQFVDTIEEANELIDEYYGAHRIREDDMELLFGWAIRWFDMMMPAVVQGPNQLQNLALDAQNVHTAQVSAQTRRAMDVLLAIPVPQDQTTTWQVLERYMPRINTQGAAGLKTYADMLNWYHTDTCVAPNDHLYKRLLDGCVAYINTSPHKSDLWLRLEQEMDESVGMCCMGHLTRLCNAFVGFDDRFAPPVPVGELLQQKMAAIAAKDIETYQKVEEANIVFEELHIPQDQREAWLEAF